MSLNRQIANLAGQSLATDAEVSSEVSTLNTRIDAVPTSKNAIINGSFAVWQRNSSAVTVNQNGPAYSSADRWFSYQNGTPFDVQVSRVSSGLAGFQYAMKWGRPSGGTSTGTTVIGTNLESSSSIPFQGKTVTLSFYAKKGTTLTTNPAVLLYSGTGIDQSTGLMITNSWTGWANAASLVPTLTTSWQRFSMTTTLSTSVTQLGVYIANGPTGTAGADDYVYITGVQLEVGDTATEFEHLPFGVELARCQRYYYVIADRRKTLSQIIFANGSGYQYGYVYGAFRYPTMRSSPSLKQSTGTDYYFATTGVSTVNASLVYFDRSHTDSGRLLMSVGGTTTGTMYWYGIGNDNGWLALEAEL